MSKNSGIEYIYPEFKIVDKSKKSKDFENRITEILGLIPKETTLSVDYECNCYFWEYATEGSDSSDINEHLSDFLNKIKDKADKLNEYLSELEDIDKWITVVVCTDYCTPYDIEISNDNIKILSELNCTLSFDIV